MKTLGTAKLSKGKWVIRAEPHVILRLKRTFGGIAKGRVSPIVLSDTIDVCRDLAWFCRRYPLKVTPEDYLAKREAEHQERDTLVERLLARRTKGTPFALAMPARDYQAAAARLALATRGLLIGDELGTGKSLCVICMLTDPRTRPALVVLPAHLQRQWRDEIGRFAPQLSVHILKQSEPYDYSVKTSPDVLICTYSKLHGWAETLAGVVKLVAFDEAHELRRGPYESRVKGSAKCTAAKVIADAAEFRVGLTATPIFNLGGEMFYIMNTLRPGALGDREEFVQEWCSGGALKEPEAFGAYMRSAGLMLRRTRQDVGRELKGLTRVPHYVNCDTSAIASIRGSAGELARIILGQAGRELAKGEQFRAGGEFDMRLRQATGIAKAPYVAEFVRMTLAAEPRVLLFGWHRAVFDVWLELLKEFSPVLYTGTESPAEKDKSKQAFCKGAARVMIVSLRSGAGLDGLQYSGCRTVVHGELDWSPSAHEQCEGRIDRDGQPDPVVSYYLLTDNGSDPVVADVLGVKREQLEGLRDPDGQRGLVQHDTAGAHVKRLAEEFLRQYPEHHRPAERATAAE